VNHDQATILVDLFDCVRGDPTVARGTLVRTRFRSDIFVESALVNVSGCHRSPRVQGTSQYSEPSPAEGSIHGIEYVPRFSRIVAQEMLRSP